MDDASDAAASPAALSPALPDVALPGAAAPDWPVLTAAEARVLASLIEKEATTPDVYPLTLLALLAACNQKSNRDPVMLLDEPAAVAALDRLRECRLAWRLSLAGSRVAKYRHAFTDVYHLPDEAVPLLAELILRGPQTAAALRQHAERMRPYPDAAAVEGLLQQLIEHREGPFVVRLGRGAGQREVRYAHLLCGPATLAAGEPEEGAVVVPAPPGSGSTARLDVLEREVATLRERLAALEARLGQ
jgi:uncharacterized protein YceH (UPF0502 family)